MNTNEANFTTNRKIIFTVKMTGAEMFGGKYLKFVCILAIVSFSVSVSARKSRISISPDGGYNDIVIKIKKSVPESSCTKILIGIDLLAHRILVQIALDLGSSKIVMN